MRPSSLALSLALAFGCRAAPRAVAPGVPPPPSSLLPAGERPALRPVIARERGFAELPRCEASDAITLARSTPGVPASPALARGPGGGLVAWVAIPEGERGPKIVLLPIDAQGSPAGTQQVALLDGGEQAALPALSPDGEGYLLAWRSGPAGRQQVRVRRVDAQGRPQGTARSLGAPGYVGAITLRVVEGQPVVGYAFREGRARAAGTTSGSSWATRLSIHLGERALTVEAPPGGAFVGEAPRITGASLDTLRVWALTARAEGSAADEHALVTRALRDDDSLHLVARDLDHLDALALPRGTLVTWRARVARRNVALRAAVIGDDGSSESPPVTLATFGGAADLRASLVPLGDQHVAALSLATLADDANGSVNLAVLDREGHPLGRAPALTSLLARSTAVAVAAAPAGVNEGLAWAVVDGRDSADGQPTLLFTRFGCDPVRPVPRLDVHPGTWVQTLAAPEAAPVQLARLEGSPVAMGCETLGTRPWVTHAGGEENVGLGESAAAVVLGPTGAQLWARVRAAGAAMRTVTSNLGARGAVTPPRTVPGGAGWPRPGFALDANRHGEWIAEGVTVLDAVREGAATLALLARPDPLGDEVAHTVALYREGTGREGMTVFADPLGHPRGAMFFGPSSRTLLFDDRGTLRRSEIVDGVARSPRSLLEAYPGGGELLAVAGDGALRWLALASGDPGDGRNVGAITLAALDASGLRGATRLFPEDGSVIPQRVALAVRGDRVVLLFPRNEQGGTVSWAWADLRCTLPGVSR